MQIDETDKALLAALADNARAPVAVLARRLGLARTTVQARLERLEATGVVQGYTVQLNARMTAPLQATVLISIEPRSGPTVLSRLTSLPGVNRVHTTSGRFDLIASLQAETTEELDEMLDDL